MTRVAYPSLEHVAMQARPYPRELLADCDTGLVLFAAAFLGHNDAVHFAEAGVRDVTLVDVDGERLGEMAELYRSDEWTFVEDDAFAYSRDARGLGAKYDAVSVDTFTGAAMDRSLDDLCQWTELARRVVTVTALVGSRFSVPLGWNASTLDRGSDAVWLILTPAVPA